MELEAKELRIDNYILNGIAEPFKVNGETINNFNAGQSALGLFHPIPLTEEWLLKFGFEVSAINENWYDKNSFSVLENGISFCYNHCGNYINIGASTRYVHQLQNLYFALTGEELTIK